jgi:hypothetical protein
VDRPRRRLHEQEPNLIPRTTYYRSGGRSGGASSPFEQTAESKHKTKLWLKAVDVVFLFLLLFLLGRSLLLEPRAKVVASDLSYQKLVSYQNTAGFYQESFSNRNKVTFNGKSIEEGLKKTYPEINTVSIELPIFGSKPIISLDIAAPSFFLQTGGNIYLADSNGRVVALKSQYPNIKNLPLIIDESGYGVKPGSLVLGKPNVDFINQLIAETKNHRVPIKSITLPAAAEEIDLRTTDKPYFAKFYMGGDPNIQIGQLLAARANFARKNIQPSSYLDVRVSGKVFYQ